MNPCSDRFRFTSFLEGWPALLALLALLNEPLNAAEDAMSPYQPEPYIKLQHPAWSYNATIYQINTRQFTAEGTFRAAQRELPRLRKLGADILWLMPIHPIGEKHRKGKLGSPYAVRDYYDVNPEFGTLDDLKNFVDAAHAQGMYVILDWVANHTAWDNALVEQHPEWYERDWQGNFRPTPWWDWSDIIDLDYSQPGLRKYMTDAMKYWVREVDVDGYRCDVAGFVPIDFWNKLRAELDAIKPVFMLAEWESRDLHEYAFDMTYAWSWTEAVEGIVKGHQPLSKLFVYYSWNESAFPPGALRMTQVSNHDMNAWDGSALERFGDGIEAAIVLSVVGEGLPLIYNGQEAGNTRRLEFFDRDPIQWRPHPIGELYRQLFTLQHENSALWHDSRGGTMVRIWNSAPDQVLSFVRSNEKDKVFAVINFSDQSQEVSFEESLHHGRYRDYFNDENLQVDAGTTLKMPPWSYRVLVQ
jgi:glycosidase